LFFLPAAGAQPTWCTGRGLATLQNLNEFLKFLSHFVLTPYDLALTPQPLQSWISAHFPRRVDF
jgi:hypothetical protein